MTKLVNFLVKKPGMTAKEFRDYYEANHVPMAFRTFPQILEHRRFYPDESSVYFPEGVDQPWDAIVEITFAERKGFEDMMALLSDPVASAEIVADGDNFLDGAKCGMMLMDQMITKRG